MAEADLVAERRERTGKKRAREIRAEEMVPGIYYAPGEEALSIKVDNKLLHATLSSGRPIVNLDLGGKTIRKCIIKEVQVDPLSDELIHVDLMGIKMDKPLDISLPVHLTGDSIGVSVSGGVVQQPLREILIRALPADIPDFIELNISELDIGDSIHVREVIVPQVEILTDPNNTVVSVVIPTIMIEPEIVEDEELLEGEEVEGEEVEGEEVEGEEGEGGEEAKEESGDSGKKKSSE